VKKRTTTGGVARNRKSKAENIEAFLKAVASGETLKSAAQRVGISHTNAANWRHDIPGFAEQLEEAQEKGKAPWKPRARDTVFRLGIEGVVEEIRDKRGNIVWDPLDENGELADPSVKNPVKWRKATRRVHNMKAMELALNYLFDGQFGAMHKFNVQGEVTHKHDVTDDVKKLLADRESLDLANALARRMALNAGGDGQSSN
jgi:hypothetical protein